MSRDTQFAGFAALLLKDIDKAIGAEADRAERGEFTQTREEFAEMLGTIIARRAYDLVCHVAAELTDETKDYLVLIEKIPDLTELPEV